MHIQSEVIVSRAVKTGDVVHCVEGFYLNLLSIGSFCFLHHVQWTVKAVSENPEI